MENIYPPQGFTTIHTLRNHPGAYTIRNRRNKNQQREQTNSKKLTLLDPTQLNPWKRHLEFIEGKCGQAVTAYFKFLRKLIFINAGLSMIVSGGIILPYICMRITGRISANDDKPCEYPVEDESAKFVDYVLFLFNGQMLMEKTFVFYGFYETTQDHDSAYNNPVLYLATIFTIYLFSLIVISIQAGRSMEAQIVGKSGQMFKYSKLIFGWDMNISDRETALIKKKLLAMKIKNELKEDKLISEQENWNFIERFYVYFIRFFTTIGNLAVLLGSILCVVLAATKGKELQSDSNFLKFLYSYLVSITMGGTSIICPIFFKIFTSFQKLRAETRMNQVIGWRVALRFLSITAVFITIFLEISKCHDRDFLQSSSLNESHIETHFSCTCENALFTCWPTVLGQECYRLTIGWLLGQLGSVFILAGTSKVLKRSFGWHIPFVTSFDITDNVLKIVSWQTIAWLGVFYCPLLPILIFLIQVLVFSVNRFAVVTIYEHNDDNHYKSSNADVYFTVLMVIGFYLGTLMTLSPLIIFSPSSSCGPFQGYQTFAEPFMNFIGSYWRLEQFWSVISSKTFLYSVILIFTSICYFLYVKSCGLNERIKVLEDQLTKEGEDQQFLMLNRRNGSSENQRNNSSNVSRRRPEIIERADQMRETAFSRPKNSSQNSNNAQRQSGRSHPTERERAQEILENRSSVMITRESVISWT